MEMVPMERKDMAGKIFTVLGLIKPEELGKTIAHEHLVADFRCAWMELPYATDRAKALEPFSLKNSDWIRKHRFNVLDNLLLMDEDEAVEEAMLFKARGGDSMFELSNKSMARDPLALQRISRRTGLHIVMGGGYYVVKSHAPSFKNRDVDSLTEEFINEVRYGADGTGIRPGILGELGCTWPLHPDERKVLVAAARTQKATGIPINVHPGWSAKSVMDILEILSDNGADLTHVAMSHTDRTLLTHEERVETLKSGCYLVYDSIGREGYFDQNTIIDIPNDNYRANHIIKLIEEGYGDKIMLSADVCTKDQRVKYGGHGYVHILSYFEPLLLKKGISREIVDKLLIHNPARSATYF
ncbi:hypothetical protein FYJ74_01815 [Pyramidobacter sp. SM-530-WT-4B]|uniref:Phosphotriesterase-related protein n=1 Tax=Pyramidobacter porci TaxID=2605789 RepID=A0A6L5Y9U6_9BACT|nr:hypothetical protein [Pyramidobacter porci]MST54788.1 hypothetical protein [Pyramidobacter porci]